MSARTEISWADATWSPVTGCTRVSAGCDHCYIERTPPFRMAGRRFDRPGIGGTTGVQLHPERMTIPIRWRKPRRVFVCSMADLFHKDVPDDYLALMFAVMATASWHTFQVLTKRHARMRALLTSKAFREAVAEEVFGSLDLDSDGADAVQRRGWPLPNVWLGVTTEDQKAADLRIPILLDTPAAVHWVSCEPALGPIDLRCPAVRDEALGFCAHVGYCPSALIDGLDWVVAGGESGPGARPMRAAWVRQLRDQCATTGVAFHFKQWGESAPLDQLPEVAAANWEIRNEPGYPAETLCRVGKKAAGRELDGRTHDAYPAQVAG